MRENWVLHSVLTFWLLLGFDKCFSQEIISGDGHKSLVVIFPDADPSSIFGEDYIKTVIFGRPPVNDSMEDFSNSLLSAIGSFEKVEQVYIVGPTSPISAKTIKEMGALFHLKEVSISKARLNPEATKALLELPLETLKLDGVPVGQSIRYLNKSRLKRLSLFDCGLENDAAAFISNSKSLVEVEISYNELVDSEFLSNLRDLPQLQSLDVVGHDLILDVDAVTNLGKFEVLNRVVYSKMTSDAEKILIDTPVMFVERDGLFEVRNMSLDR